MNADAAAEAQSPRRRGPAGLGRFAAALTAAIVAMLVSNNWCWIVLPVALAALIVDHVVCARWLSLPPRLVAAGVVGAAAGLALNIGPDWAFRETFGIPPPAGVRDVRIWRHYVGGPGEHILIMEFTADAAALRQLTALRPPQADSPRVRAWRATSGGWPETFRLLAGPTVTPLPERSWRRIHPLDNPQVVDFGVDAGGGQLFFLFEAERGRCVSLHVRL